MATTQAMSLMDASFFLMETPVTPLHIAAGSLFRLPSNGDGDYVRRLHEHWRRFPVNRAPFNFRLGKDGLSTLRPEWDVLDSVDLDQHLFRIALPRPGGDEELEQLLARLHERPLDRSRPMWEIYLIEGLSDRRFATYTKIHHSLADGTTAVRLFSSQYTPDADDRSTRPVWNLRRPAGAQPSQAAQPARSLLQGLPLTPGAARQVLGRAVHGARNVLTLVSDLKDAPLSARAPETIFGRPVTARRKIGHAVFAFDRVKGVSKALGSTINDVALVVCGGALRRYLQGIDALPDESVVCAMPISLNKEGNVKGGNTVASVPVALGTDIDDVRQRFEVIRDSMQDIKARLAKMSVGAIGLTTTVSQVPVLFERVTGRWPLPHRINNVILSNVPGPRERLYLHGAEYQGSIPLPMILNGIGLNITIVSFHDRIWFSYTSCPDIAPHIDRLGPLITRSFEELERVMARRKRPAKTGRRARGRKKAARAR